MERVWARRADVGRPGTVDPDRTPRLDGTASLLLRGYRFLPEARMRRGNADAFALRLFGRRTLVLHGTEATRVFYDDARFERRGALPEPVLATLVGKGAVHTLDDEAHRVRKAMFVQV